MEVRTRVREVHGDRASLVCDGADRCDVCGAGPGAGCGSAFGPASCGLTVPRSLRGPRGLLAGDVVVLSVASGAIVRVAALTYLLPVAGLLAGAGLATLAGVSDGAVFLAAAGGGLAGVSLGRRAGSRGFRAVPRQPGNADA
jgi:positive regulator of sigma E activity